MINEPHGVETEMKKKVGLLVKHIIRSVLVLVLLAMTVLSPTPAMAVTPANGVTPTLTPVTINSGAGDQNDPHISGDWVAYTSDASMRYYNFATNTDAQIPIGNSISDLLSDISGRKIVFSRVIYGEKTAVMVFDAATPATAPIELDPAPATTRIGSAIGGNTVAYVDFGLHARGELVIHDLTTSTSVRITNDTAPDQNPQVSSSGNVVAWEHCSSSLSNCDIWQAVKSGAGWSISVVSGSADPEGNPDTNGTLVVYDSFRGNSTDIFWRPVSGGTEVQLQMPSFEANPSLAGNLISFESRPTLLDTTDIFVYDIITNFLYQITDTPLVTEQLNDITVLSDGRIRVVWASDEDGFDQRNIKAATFPLPATDADQDGVSNGSDLCPGTPSGELVDANGCSAGQLDDDLDGVFNASDQCPATPAGDVVNPQGCSWRQINLPGRMTGGGSVLSGETRVTHGLVAYCDTSKGGRLQINWGKGNSFKVELVESFSCSDDPAISPGSGFDTYKGIGSGKLNGVSGAKAEWTFSDAGEPGYNDNAKIVIKDASGNIVLDVMGSLEKGNHQAHAD